MVAASFHLVHMGLNSKRKSGGGGEVEDEEEKEKRGKDLTM